MIQKVMFLMILTLLVINVVSGQEDDLRPIYTGETIDGLYWSSDSQNLTYPRVIAGSTQLDQSWVMYNINSSIVTNLDIWPIQTLIPNVVNRILGGTRSAPLQTNVFMSPNYRYAVAVDVIDRNNEGTLMVVDTDDGQIIDTGIAPLGIELAPHLFQITWSHDGETFVVATSALMVYEPSFFHWVSNYTLDIPQPEVRDITSFSMARQVYGTRRVYDVSQNGQLTLIHALTSPPDNSRNFYPLVIWQSDDNHQILMNDFNKRPGITGILTATFAPNDENDILVVDDRGLVRYSLETGETVVLREDINSERFSDAAFSPNGEQLALVDQGPGRPTTVYLLDVSKVLE